MTHSTNCQEKFFAEFIFQAYGADGVGNPTSALPSEALNIRRFHLTSARIMHAGEYAASTPIVRAAVGRVPGMRRWTLLRGEETNGTIADNRRQTARRIAGAEEVLEALGTLCI